MLEHDFQIGAELEFELPRPSNAILHSAWKPLLEESLVRPNKKKNPAILASLKGNYKYDATINYGFEYATLPIHCSQFLKEKQDYHKIFSFFNKYKIYVDKHLGMHIHVDKAKLTKEDVCKINYFVYRNADFCKLIGERNFTKYCRFRENSNDEIEINAPWITLLHQRIGYDQNISHKDNHKHRMLNVARPKTIEFRFFQSTNKFNIFLRNIEFVIALVNFVKSTKLSVDDFKIGGAKTIIAFGDTLIDEEEGLNTIIGEFRSYVNKHKETYKELNKFIKKNKNKL